MAPASVTRLQELHQGGLDSRFCCVFSLASPVSSDHPARTGRRSSEAPKLKMLLQLSLRDPPHHDDR